MSPALGGVPARAVSSKPLVGGAEADSGLCGKGFEWLTLVEITTNQPFPTERRQRAMGWLCMGCEVFWAGR